MNCASILLQQGACQLVFDTPGKTVSYTATHHTHLQIRQHTDKTLPKSDQRWQKKIFQGSSATHSENLSPKSINNTPTSNPAVLHSGTCSIRDYIVISIEYVSCCLQILHRFSELKTKLFTQNTAAMNNRCCKTYYLCAANLN